MIYLLQYQGIGWVSKSIRFQTRGKHSHTAPMLSDGTVIEAWHRGGERFWHGSVRHIESPFYDHAPGTVIDVFEITEPFDEDAALAYWESRVGNQYDFRSVFRFLSRKDAPENCKDFCSELFLTGMLKGGLPMLTGNPSHMSPRDVGISPLINHVDQLMVPKT